MTSRSGSASLSAGSSRACPCDLVRVRPGGPCSGDGPMAPACGLLLVRQVTGEPASSRRTKRQGPRCLEGRRQIRPEAIWTLPHMPASAARSSTDGLCKSALVAAAGAGCGAARCSPVLMVPPSSLGQESPGSQDASWSRVRCTAIGRRVPDQFGFRILSGACWEQSLISPIPAHSRTASIPATAADLSSKPDDTAITTPLESRSRNLNCDCASTNNSKRPVIGVPPEDGKTPV